MAYELEFQVKGLDKFIKRLRATEKEIDNFNFSSGFKEAVERVKSRQERRWYLNFNSEGAEYGVNWAGIHNSTMSWREARGSFSNKILVDSGHSRGMLKPFMDENASVRFHSGGAYVDWDFTGQGSSDFPLPFHHFGYTTPNAFGKKGVYAEVAARPIWLMDEKDEENSFRTFSRWAHDAIRGLSIFG